MKKGVDYIGVTVVFFCHDGKGNLLMHKRSKKCRDEVGRWDVGGGSMKVGETFEQAVLREIKEEYCCVPKNLVFVKANNVLRKNRQENTHWVAIIFAATVNPKQVKIGDPDKIDAIGWFSEEKLPKPLHTMVRPHLKFVKDSGAL